MSTHASLGGRKRRTGLLLSLPCLLFVFLFIIYPLFRNVQLSLNSYNPLKSPETRFVGLENYAWLIREPAFFNSLLVTLAFTAVSVMLELLLGFTISYLLSRIKEGLLARLSAPLTSSFLIPWVIPGISAAVAWRFLYHPSFGLINALLGRQVMWISNPTLALFSVVVADVWKTTPFFVFILLAGFLSIPPEQYEAAKVDGVSAWKELWYITIPSILPLMLVTTGFRAIDAFTKIFDLVYVLTAGGPGKATEVLPLLIYKTALKYFRFGTAASISVVAILISFVFGAMLLRARRAQ